MIPFDAIMVPLSAALGLSLTIERILELTQNILEAFLGKKLGRKIPKVSEPDKEIENLEKIYERDRKSEEVEKEVEPLVKDRIKIKAEYEKETDPAKRQELREKLLALEKDGEWGEQIDISICLAKPATDPDDGKTLKMFILQFGGFALGIILVHYTGIQLFNAFLTSLNSSIRLAPWLDYLLTGLLIGGGSGPMHILIRFVTQRKITVAEEKPISAEAMKISNSTEKPSASAPAIISQPISLHEAEWFDIPYYGGVDREILEGIHLRDKDPDMIIYHHTAMSSWSTFEDVVEVIKSHKDSNGSSFITGYNCVIMADGSVCPFCRWDRYGSHAVGYNRRSLGIAFNGNFEYRSSVPYSNPDGRLGSLGPTEVQLKAGARVVTLWTFIYPIDVDFDKKIIPHKKIASKTCPGSAFPYDEFKRLVEFFRNQWEKSEAIQARIEEFKLKSLLYVKKEA